MGSFYGPDFSHFWHRFQHIKVQWEKSPNRISYKFPRSNALHHLQGVSLGLGELHGLGRPVTVTDNPPSAAYPHEPCHCPRGAIASTVAIPGIGPATVSKLPSNLVDLFKAQGGALIAYLDFRLLKSLVFKAFRS